MRVDAVQTPAPAPPQARREEAARSPLKCADLDDPPVALRGRAEAEQERLLIGFQPGVAPRFRDAPCATS